MLLVILAAFSCTKMAEQPEDFPEFKFLMSKIGTNSADIKVCPLDSEITYYWAVLSKDEY